MTHLLQICEPGQTPDPHSNSRAVGIDLGTTHSVVAIADGQRAQAISDAYGTILVPSVVYEQGSDTYVGQAACAKRAEGAQVHASIKRLMGKLNGNEAELPVRISAAILRHMKQQAEIALGQPVHQAVITVPAYFDDAARIATRDAARIAGLEVLRLINEPTAAALAYGLDTKEQGVFAIYDLGGGTFDISVLRLEAGVFQVLATAGDTALGGDDVDAALLAHCYPDTTPSNSLLLEARRIKEALSDLSEAEWNNRRVTRADLAHAASPLIRRTLACTEQALRDAALSIDDIDGVVLVGGSTRLLAVRDAVEDFFRQPPLTNLNPDEVVALGAAIQAQALTHGADHLLLDVTPLSLGIETMGGIVEKIIHRNTPIPAQVTQEFTTYEDGQTAMRIHVLQGEREKVADCRSLGMFQLSGIPPMVAGAARIRIDFQVDADGLLTVSATETTSNTSQTIEVQPAYGLAFEDIERMLLESMEHAKTDILERLLIEARVEAERAIGEVERAMQSAPEYIKQGEHSMISGQIALLRRAIEGADRDRIDYEVEQLNRLVGPFAERRMNAAIADALAGKHVNAVET